MDNNPNQTPPSRDVWLSKARAVYEKMPGNRLAWIQHELDSLRDQERSIASRRKAEEMLAR